MSTEAGFNRHQCPRLNGVVSLASSQIAFQLNDLEFMCDTVMSIYMYNKWRGLEFAMLTSQTDTKSLSMLSPQLAYRIVRNLGFAGGIADPALVATLTVWHTTVLTSVAFYHSPRGR